MYAGGNFDFVNGSLHKSLVALDAIGGYPLTIRPASFTTGKSDYDVVYLSPAKDYIIAEGSDESIKGVITDMQGRALIQVAAKSGEPIRISHLANGMYILRLSSGHSFKIIKQ